MRKSMTSLGLIISFWLYVFASAYAHHAPSGWEYPSVCCNKNDCYPIQQSDVEWTDDGYLIIKATGEKFPVESVRDSGDGHWHRCSSNKDPKNPTKVQDKLPCLYKPVDQF